MPKRSRYRITNGHRAAVCGLTLCGISLTQACEIVGVPYQQMRDLLGDWHKKLHPRRRWKGYLLEDLHADWIDLGQQTKTIATRYNTTVRQLNLLAKSEGWPLHQRKHGPPRSKHSILSMTPEAKRRFWKLQRVLGRSAAVEIVTGDAR